MAKKDIKQDNNKKVQSKAPAKVQTGKKKGEETNMERARKMAAKSQSKKKEKQSIRDYLKGVKLEMSKVVWPTRQELITYTGVVIGTCAVFALGFWLIDTGFLALLKAVLGITLS